MGLKCSVLGHKYGDATVERDREEQGSEVVITIREIETCSRCEEERVVSENKEVTTLATPDEPTDAEPTDDDDMTVGRGSTDRDSQASEDAGSSEAGTEQSGSEPQRADTPDEPQEDAEVFQDEETPAQSGVASLDDAPEDGDGADDAELIDAGPTDEPIDDPADDQTDDATADAATESAPPVDTNEGVEILEAEADESAADDELADPSIEDAEFTTDPVEDEPVEEDAVIIGEDDGNDQDDDDDRAHGAWPAEPDDGADDADWTPSDGNNGAAITAPDAGTEHNTAVTIPDGQFRCPACEYTTLVADSSLRAGDFCPDCHKGSLVHEPRDETRKE